MQGTEQLPMFSGFVHTSVRAPDPTQCPQELCVHNSRENSFKGISVIRKITVLTLFRHVNADLILGSERRRSQLSMVF